MSVSLPKSSADQITKMLTWFRRTGLARKASFLLVVSTIFSGLATFIAMTSSGPEGSDPALILNLLYLDAILMLLLGAMIVRRLVNLKSQHSRGAAGSKLHTRLVLFFSLLAVTPAILVAIFAGLYLNLGMQSWFSERVSTALSSSKTVAKAYRAEHVRSIQIDALGLANSLNRKAPQLSRSRYALERELNRLALEKNLVEAALLDGQGRVIAQTALTLSLAFDKISKETFEKANQNDVVSSYEAKNDRARAVVKLERYIDTYLFIGRFIPPEISGSINRVETAYKQYSELEKRREGIHISFIMIFMIIALMLLLAAAWLGMMFANQMVRPLTDLIEASERIRKGDLAVRVDKEHSADEIGLLGRAFNRMTEQLEAQRESLVEANRELAERHRFTETVLDGVTAGVIGIDPEGFIHLPNRFASLFLKTEINDLIGKPLREIVPELEELLSQASLKPNRPAQEEVKLLRDGQVRIINANIAAEWVDDDLIGYVLTFDDITELQSAQRRAAWANVARRIAHEIKNPLTPIQLSAERLKRKYLKDIKNDPETFSMCTETIIRQVDDMRNMVDEFSSFARMPRPVLKMISINELCGETIFLEKNRTEAINYELDLPDTDIALLCDRQQVSRLLTNLVKNAAEGIFTKFNLDGESPIPEGMESPIGTVSLKLFEAEGEIVITIADNGVGFPQDERERLTDPYVTTRTKGTGLGLAIVKKIMEEHQGQLALKDREGGGAIVELRFPELEEYGQPAQEDNKEEDPMKMTVRLVTDGA
ncbi:Nitrogen regulation protein NtrY homolog [Candidatus Terasakiella magnetica]|uniref:Nitrogen regulation protein n=1 Tax=Candidatus Terasakiella magnetica TaxID=1867952 RepID=A0A1C3RD27_9PROT|nr:PAS domain-containing sensor histidine kinase [Candidatus Terasakiella magnetica]SCA55168.1 Nitrogen regulation protein NtrY homolog [Candidatus Terasakiella magnetica]